MARPCEFDRNEVIDQAIELFWRKGYRATSIQDLVEATGVNRGSLYATFGDKAGLFGAAVDRYMAGSDVQRQFAANTERPIGEVLSEVFGALVEAGACDGDRRGCLVTNTAVELMPHDQHVADKIARNLDGLENILCRRLGAAQRHGEIAPGKNPRALARFVVSSIQGIRVMSKVAPKRRVLQDIADEVLAHVTPVPRSRPQRHAKMPGRAHH